jgi:hypothetical protein
MAMHTKKHHECSTREFCIADIDIVHIIFIYFYFYMLMMLMSVSGHKTIPLRNKKAKQKKKIRIGARRISDRLLIIFAVELLFSSGVKHMGIIKH